MSRTYRWWDKDGKFCRPSHRRDINPFYGKHEYKGVRVTQHRNLRHENKILLRKGLDPKYTNILHTEGWITN